jgi:spermidine synthase
MPPHQAMSRPWRPPPPVTVFVSSACIMTLELVAGRIIAPYAGVSLFTWTSVIGVVLAGISLGNYLGGRWADRWASPHLLGILLSLSSLAALSILSVDVLQRFSYIESVTVRDLPLIAGLVLLVVLLFLVPCVLLGTVSPIVAKLAVRDLNTTGSTVGMIYAAGSVGSIVGTFATGFTLISWVGTHAVVWGVAVVLLILAIPYLPGRYRRWFVPAMLVLVTASALAFGQGWLRGPCTRETDYFCIQVRDDEYQGQPVRLLYLDRLLHSYTSPQDPTKLVYEYEQLYAQATAYQAQRKNHLRALFIGGGGYTFPRYMEALYPSSDIDVIEIDPGVTQVAHDMLGLSRDTQVVTYNEDARMFLQQEPDSHYDLILGDAFNDFSVPYHLTTKEFNDRVHAWLADDGLYVVNIIDGPWGRFLRAYIHTLRQTFRYVHPVFSIESWRHSPRSTIVIIASDTPLDRASVQATAPRLAEQLLTEDQVDVLLAEGRVVTLTDRYAPVDQLLIPVFLDQVPR